MPAPFEVPALPSRPRGPLPTRFTPRTPSAALAQPFPSPSTRHSKGRALFANSQADPADGLRSEIRFERFDSKPTWRLGSRRDVSDDRASAAAAASACWGVNQFFQNTPLLLHAGDRQLRALE